MTDVKNNKNNLIETPADAQRLYVFAQEQGGRIGLEVEMALYQPRATGVGIPQAAEMVSMQTVLRDQGYDAQLEAAGVLEYASPPMLLTDIAEMAARVTLDLELFESTAARQGYRRAPFSILPTTTLTEAFNKRVPRERLDVAINALKDFYGPCVLPIPLLTTGVQASFSPQNADEMFAMAKRGYALTPLLIAAMNSGTGYVENKTQRADIHQRSAYYEPYGSSAGIAQSFTQAHTAEEYIRQHIEAVFDAPMFFCYDHDGTLLPSAKGNVLTFRDLAARGLNTQSNYELAESFLYNDIKICNLRDGEGHVIGKRLEVRAPDSGLHQPLSVLLLTAALVPSGPTATAFEALLADYGFTGDPVTDAPLLHAARHAAVHHDGRFMDVDFGRDPVTGAARSLRDLAADVAGLLSAHYAAEKSLQPALSKLTDILLTGNCDAKNYAAQYPQLPDLKAYLMTEPAVVVAPVRKARPRYGR